MTTSKSDTYFDQWKNQEAAAESMLSLIGQLYRTKGVNLYLYGQRLANKNTVQILQHYKYANDIQDVPFSTVDSLEILTALSKLELSPSRIDLGKLTVDYLSKGTDGSVEAYVANALTGINTGNKPVLEEPQDVVLYGFGRIGRLLARMLVERVGGGDKLRLRAIVVRKGKKSDLAKRASLLQHDSVHGPFNGVVTIDEEENALIINGNMVRIIYSNGPDQVDYEQYGINNAIIVDNTGIWTDRESLGLHLKSKGVSKVLLTAPGKGDVPNVVFGINSDTITSDENIVSAASCTTNAIVPTLKVINDQFGIKSGHVETCHSYTNDQNLIDNYHSKPRRGRAAAMNMVITSTGAAKAATKALPELAGKLTGNAIRVPTPNVSLAIMNLNLEKATTVEEINVFMRDVAFHSELQNQIDYSPSDELVSTDFVGSHYAGIYDAPATIVDGDRCVLYVWYDNEFGYSWQVIRLLQQMANITFQPTLP